MAEVCSIDGCARPAARGGLCWGHLKRRQRGAVVDVELRPAAGGQAPVTLETSRGLFLDAVLAYADAPVDDDDEYRRALDRLEKAAVAFARRRTTARVRESLAQRKAAGKPVGRPPRLQLAALRRALELAGTVRGAAKVLRVSRVAVQRAMRRYGLRRQTSETALGKPST